MHSGSDRGGGGNEPMGMVTWGMAQEAMNNLERRQKSFPAENKAAHDSSTFAEPGNAPTRGKTNYLYMRLRKREEYVSYLQGLLEAQGIPYKKAHP